MITVADQETDPKQVVLNALLRSGFPFQTAVAEVVRRVPNCRIQAEEVPWRDTANADHFLDLVVLKSNFVIAIECKKTQKEIFTFLQPSTTTQEHVIRARCLYVNRDNLTRFDLRCGDWDITPRTIESTFCVVGTSDSGKDQRLLEKDAQLLVRGSDEYGRYVRSQREVGYGPNRVIVPVIVTNARLFAANYNPSDISLETGQIPTEPQPDISPVSCVRFRKAFSIANRDMGDRTVFVVSAHSLHDFLNRLDYTSVTPSPHNPVLLPSATL